MMEKSTKSEVIVRSASTTLTSAATEARMLVNYLAREGIEFDTDSLNELLSCVENIETSNLDAAVESAFWIRFREFSNLAKPVRIDALHFLNRKNGELPSEERSIVAHQRALRFFRWFATISFLFTIVFLAYISVSESIVQDNERLGHEYFLLGACVSKGTILEKLNITQTDSNIIDGGAAIDNIGGDYNGKSLCSWTANANGLAKSRRAEIQTLVEGNDHWLSGMQRPLGFGRGNIDKGKRANPYDLVLLTSQRNINRVITGYILPTLAAVLGVCVFIIKAGSRKMETLSFRLHTSGIYWHQFVLGVISGIAASWFQIGSPGNVTSTITPVALAFLVGYSVDVLYNILDSLVSALSGRKAEHSEVV